MTRRCSHILPSTLTQHEQWFWMELAGLKVGHAIKNDIDLRVVNGYFKQAIPTHVITCLCHIRNRNQGHKNCPECSSNNVRFDCHQNLQLPCVHITLIHSFIFYFFISWGAATNIQKPHGRVTQNHIDVICTFVILCSCQLYGINRDKVDKFP